MIVNGFCKDVFKELPMEFAVEAQKLLGRLARRIGRMTDATRSGQVSPRDAVAARDRPEETNDD